MALEINQVLPHDEIAEKALLGAMLLDNRYVNQVFSEVSSEDFFRDSHVLVAQAVLQLTNAGSAADIITVSSLLEKRKKLQFVGGHAFITALVDDIPESLDIQEYIKIVKDRSTLRKIILTSRGIIQKGVDPGADTVSLLNEMQEDIIKISEDRVKKGFVGTSEMVPEAMQLIERIQGGGEAQGLKTGLYELDDITSGFQNGDLIVFAARPSMGKTALALNIAVHMAVKEEKSVAFFSIEMSRLQVLMRMLAIHAKVSMAAIRTGKPHLTQKEWRDLELAASELQKAKLFVDDSASLSIVEMKARTRKLKVERNLDIVFVDYLQLMKVTGEHLRRSDTRAQEVAVITAALKELAKELQIPVVAMAQLNRAPETRGGKREKGPKYQLSDLKESGSIEQDADVVIFIHRDDQFDKDSERKGEADLIVAKQRNGPTGKVVLAFLDKFTKFANLEFSSRE
ncbi:MAG: replicative DNA helicase [Acidobacteria bacterium]|jgi:replicative DNA helicase|nr:replicative DNA helicase [Acidobacteriota bacterium]